MSHRFSIIAVVATTSLLLTCGGSTAQEEPAADEGKAFAERMAKEHEGDEPTASPHTTVPPSAPVETTEVTYATVDGKAIRGVLATPAGSDSDQAAPGIIVIHEWWGLNDNVKAMAERLAGQGYQALAVDLYSGEVAADRDGAMKLMGAAGDNQASVEENLRQAYAYLTTERGADTVGVIGWCFGGGWSLRTALLLPDEIDATVIYYGRLVDDRTQLATLEMPVIGFFGSEDQGIPVAGVRAFEQALKDLGKSIEFHIYDGANHAFANPSGGRYDAAAAEDAWARTVAFFNAHL